MKRGCLIFACALCLAACGTRQDPPTVLVGIDGGEWQVIDEMIAAGELPNLARIKREGAWGHLINNGMENSPVVWTTIATGHFARQHGVLDHVFPFGGDGPRRPVTSELRRVPALWNIATHYGLRSIVVGYFVSHPPEPIDGIIVSSQAPTWEKGAIYPEDALPLEEWLYQELKNPGVRSGIWQPFFGWNFDPAQAEDPESPYRAAADIVVGRDLAGRIVRDEFLRRAVHTLTDEPSDLFIAYYRIPDLVSHLLWKYYDPQAYESPPSKEEMEWFGESVRQSYRFVDQALGGLIKGWDGEANIIIVSDHGFGRAAAHKMEAGNEQVKHLTGDHRPDGIILATGPDIEPGQIEGLTIMEIAPTLAALMELPVAGELPGNVATGLLREGFLTDHPIQSVADYSFVAMPHGEVTLNHAGQEDEMNTLKGLGYVGEGVEFDVTSTAGEYDFWAADEPLVAAHMSSEIFYYLLRGETDLADEALDLLLQHRPDAAWRALVFTEHRFASLREGLPQGILDASTFESFFKAHPFSKFATN